MELDIAFENKWKKLETFLANRFGKVPNMEAILYLIGINEFRGRMPKYKFSKEEKQDLIHVGTCTLMMQEGFYQLEQYDKDGWPHFKKIKELEHTNLEEQENMLKQLMFQYFEI